MLDLHVDGEPTPAQVAVYAETMARVSAIVGTRPSGFDAALEYELQRAELTELLVTRRRSWEVRGAG